MVLGWVVAFFFFFLVGGVGGFGWSWFGENTRVYSLEDRLVEVECGRVEVRAHCGCSGDEIGGGGVVRVDIWLEGAVVDLGEAEEEGHVRFVELGLDRSGACCCLEIGVQYL